jgi:hypothetical protein
MTNLVYTWQIGTPWFDGTEGVTQCPILPGDTFVYQFVVDRVSWCKDEWIRACLEARNVWQNYDDTDFVEVLKSQWRTMSLPNSPLIQTFV